MNIISHFIESVWTAAFDAIFMWLGIAFLFCAIMIIPQVIFDFDVIDIMKGPYREYGYQTFYILCFLTYLIKSKPLTEILSDSKFSFKKKKTIQEGIIMFKKFWKFLSEGFWFLVLLVFAGFIYLLFLPEVLMGKNKP